MAIHATLVLDSGAFFQDLQIGQQYDKLEVGFFGSCQDTAEIQVVVDGNPIANNETKLGKGRIEVVFKKAAVPEPGKEPRIEVTDAFVNNLLRIKDLYPVDTPVLDEDKFDCTFIFTSGRFCCSMVKARTFAECTIDTGAKTGQKLWSLDPADAVNLKADPKTPKNKPISHNVAVHFELEKGDSLELKRSDNTILFTTANLPPDAKRVEVEIVADNTTATKFFQDALKLKGKNAWLPNQGDPPTVGPP